MTTPRSPTDLADTIDGAMSILLRWPGLDAMRTLRLEEKDMIVAALRLYAAADGGKK